MIPAVTVLPLEGFKSLRALNAFHTLMLGLKMLPAYMGEPYEKFFARVGAMPIEDQYRMIREAAAFVELSQEEVEALVGFTSDPNGIPYGPPQLKTMKPGQILDLVCAVCLEIAKMKIDLVSEAEKKN